MDEKIGEDQYGLDDDFFINNTSVLTPTDLTPNDNTTFDSLNYVDLSSHS
jgi:hypothetical protein